MPPESDPHFKAAFAELHRRRCAQAPSFEAMRARAQRAARAAQPSPERPRMAGRVRWAAAGACLAMLVLGWGAWLAWTPPQKNQTASAQRVEQLLAAIEQQLDLDTDFAAPEFPTDVLLTQNQTDPSP
jgi:ferric-dicitrate binding protein FerR (iron transport regulator)